MSHFRFVITERDGTALGEVQDASSRRVEVQLKKASTAGFSIRTTNPLLDELYSGDKLLKVYHHLHPTDTEALVFHGPIISLEATLDEKGPSVAATATDPAFFFTKRVSGKRAQWTSGYNGTLFNAVDKLTITKSLIDQANTDGETGVRTVAMTSGTTAVYIAGPYKLLDECINELADTFDGFDWVIDPIEYDAGKIGEFRGAAVIGSTKANAAFEYGPATRNNIRDFTYQRTWEHLANRIYNIPQTLALTPADSTQDVIERWDTPSLTDHGLYGANVESGDVTNVTLRNAVSDFHLAIRAQPRNVLSFSPVVDPGEASGAVPVFGHDYGIGDLVPVRIAPEGHTLIEGNVRIYKVLIEIDNDDRTLYTPTTVPE